MSQNKSPLIFGRKKMKLLVTATTAEGGGEEEIEEGKGRLRRRVN